MNPLLALLFVPSFIWVGNPTLQITLDDADLVSASAFLAEVTVTHCDNTEDSYVVDVSMDADDTIDLTLQGGDLCSVTLQFQGSLSASQSGATGHAASPTVQVPLTGPGESRVRVPGFAVDSGTWLGDDPAVVVSMP